MGKKSFTWNPNGVCIFGSITNPTSECVFDYWSFYHFYFTGFFYIILHHWLGITTLKQALLLCLLVTALHVGEEILGNTSKLSLEGVVLDKIGPLLDPRIDPELRFIDNDYLENSIGDVSAGVISCLLIIWHWQKFGILPYFYLWLLPIPILMLFNLRSTLYQDS